ncbi:hypothetical protein C2G38_2187121 [Gigaspora rosea]|uniref:Uncharacterized protein n=1 Tax=Gigaspora rosea TaxID=44941 RepID=A0A397V4X6_9GLOM|nr:hypothetical protein C2G38_2187121 [Gigaspora rosea]
MSKDITTFFTRFSSYTQKAYHESFVTKNSISWWNIDFNRSYVIQYLKRNPKEQFDFLQHTKQIPFFEFFDCKYGIRTYLENNNYCSFYPHLWHYDYRHGDFQCPFRRRFDKSLNKKEKLINLNSKGSLMRIKRMFRNLKPDYEIFLWVKSFDCTGTTQYKNQIDSELNQLISTRQQLLKEEPYTLKSSCYQPQSPSASV